MKARINGYEFDGKDFLMTGIDLKLMRLKGQKTTAELASVAGVKTRKTYENWEHNIGQPNVNQFMAMALFCGFEPGSLLGEFIKRGNLALTEADPHSLDWPGCELVAS